MKSVNQISKGYFVDRGSKFYAFLHPVNNLVLYRDLIRKYKEKNPEACHVCSAYRIYLNDWIDEYATDDGEPKGSSGLPILNALKRFDLVNIAIYVVRIYGGVNLGIPGLIKAYNTSALSSITGAKLLSWQPIVEIGMKYNYDLEKIVLAIVKSVNGNIIKQDFKEEIISYIEVPQKREEEFLNFLNEQTSGKVSIL